MDAKSAEIGNNKILHIGCRKGMLMVTTRDFFIKQGLKETQIEEFIRQRFPSGDYSHMQIQRTPLGIKIVIFTNKPGRVIGRGGRIINEMTSTIKEKFALENSELEVRGIENPDLDAHIVAKQIASYIERGFNYKKTGNMILKKVMDAGAVGVELIIGGKIAGSKAVTAKFIAGYLKLAGHPADELVDTAFESVLTKPGIIGVTVKIMKKDVDFKGPRYEELPAEQQAAADGKEETPEIGDKAADKKEETKKKAKKQKLAEERDADSKEEVKTDIAQTAEETAEAEGKIEGNGQKPVEAAVEKGKPKMAKTSAEEKTKDSEEAETASEKERPKRAKKEKSAEAEGADSKKDTIHTAEGKAEDNVAEKEKSRKAKKQKPADAAENKAEEKTTE